MRILVATDAWHPQVNGVVRTLEAVRRELEDKGHQVLVLSADRFRSIPCPGYPEIRLALPRRVAIDRIIRRFGPNSIHIATEGPIGLAVRRWCMRRGRSFTTAYHTQFPDYLAKRTKLPAAFFWRYISWFHRPARTVLVSTPTMASLLRRHGLPSTRLWGRGVDLGCFRPGLAPHAAFAGLARPIQLYVGRVAVEKNIEAFLECACPGSKVLVGGGPALEALSRHYPEALFLGTLGGADLASAYAAADVLVFPSRTDTFGLVIIEALACGTPVAAYPVPGPLDILNEEVGATDPDLGRAIAVALRKDRALCATYGQSFSWKNSAEQFEAALVALHESPVSAVTAAPPIRASLIQS